MIERFLTELFLVGAITFGTADGRAITFEPTLDEWSLRYEYSITRSHREDLYDGWPNDVLAFQVWVPDARGVTWTAEIPFLAYRLEDLVFGSSPHRDLDAFTDAPEAIRQAFEQRPVLRDIRIAHLGEPSPEPITVGDQTFTSLPGGTHSTLDLAYVADPSGDEGYLLVKMRAGSLITLDGEPVPAAWSAFYPDVIWQWSAAQYSAVEERWLDSTIPVPLVFRETDQRGTPQPIVTVR